MHHSPAPIDAELARQVWDAAPAIVLVVDPAGCVMRVNPFFLDFTGFDLSEVVGRNWFDEFLPERTRASARETFARLLEGDSTDSVINPILTRSGEERLIEWHNRVLTTAAGHEGAVLALGFDVTERVAAEAALRRSQTQLEEAQRLAKLGSWRLDLRDDTLVWSDEIFRIFEVDPSQFAASYEAFLEAVHPDDRELVDHTYAESVQSRRPYDIVHRLRLPGGLTKWVHERGETRYDERGSPVYSTGTVQDITDQVLAQRTLRESQTAYRHLYEALRLKESVVDATASAIAFWVFDGTITYVNLAFVRTFGYSDPDEIIGRSIVELATDPAAAERLVREALGEGARAIEFGARRRSGEEITLLFDSSVLRDQRGAPAQIMGVFIDVTERARSERDVRLARDLLRATVDSSPDWIFVKDLEHRFLLVNEAFAKAHDCTPAQMVGRLDAEFSPSAARFHEDDRRAFAGEVVHVPHDQITSAGGTRVFDTWKVPLRDERGAIQGVVCYSRDRTAWEAALAAEGELRAE